MEELVFDSQGLKQKASGEKKQNKQLFRKLEKLNSSALDRLIHPLHEKYMTSIDCLECANCCKSISPALKDKDVDRIAKHLRKKPSEIVDEFLLLDADGDYVFRKQPCPFLGEDNYCSIYESRPRACREYPHTDRPKQQQILKITYQNISVCPIVYNIIKDLREEF